jgi:aspartate/tyrosine/aromatic aminotransferase
MTSFFMNVFEDIPAAPPDPIFGVAQWYNASALKTKYLLSVGVYRTEDGKPYVFPAVSTAEDKIIHQFHKDYLPMIGYAPFLQRARELLWGDSLLKEMGSRIGTVQSCAGTGALYLVSSFAASQLKVPQVLLCNPSWPSYPLIFGETGNQLAYYPWVKNGGLDIDGALACFDSAPAGSLIVLQVVGHNPTGVDPTMAQWRQIFEVVNRRQHTICFDFAYMGFGSGDLETDAEAVREYSLCGREFFVAFSFSKCLGLYAERIGALHIVAKTPEQAKAVESQMVRIGRGCWSVCPQNGALIAAEVLGSPELKARWVGELKEITHRIIEIRAKLCDLLEQKTQRSWDFARKQQGMFLLTGLNREQVQELGDVEGVFLPGNGRISVPALNEANVEFIAQAIANVVNRS